MQKIIALVLALTLCLGLFAGCQEGNPSGSTPAGTNPGTNPSQGGEKPLAGTYDIKVWVAKEIKDLTKTQIDNFNNTNTDGIVINATIEEVGEGDAATQMTTDVENGADIFCFAQDQAIRLVQAGALAKLGTAAKDLVSKGHVPGAVAAVTSDNELWGYPLTADNGYFMYYDKSVIQDTSVDSLEAILADCKAGNKYFSMEIETSAWYIASWFFATGCHSEWIMEGNEFKSVDDTFNSDKGLIAVQGMKKVYDSGMHISSSSAAEFSNNAAVVVSGTWAYNDVKDQLGENMGVADLPSFEFGGQSYHLGSYSGYKLMGVKPQTDAVRQAALHKLAQYLTSETCQLERFQGNGWGPSNLAAREVQEVKDFAALKALEEQNAYATQQGQIHGSWWDIAKVIGTNVKAATDEAGLKQALADYQASIEAVFQMSDEVKNGWTVIGSINGDTWSVDLPMTKQDDGTWKSNEAYKMDAGTEFKVRQGKAWDVSYGVGADNFKVETAGTYYVVFNPDTTEVSLVAAN